MITVRGISTVVEAWCHESGHPVSWHEMVSIRRSRAVCRARAWVIWLARRHTSLSLPQIGRQMGGRDHTTILHNCRVMDALVASRDPSTLAALAWLEAGLAPLLDHPAACDVAPCAAPRRVAAYDLLVDAVEAVLSSAETAALARGTRGAVDADQALVRALGALRTAKSRLLSADEPRRRAREPRRHAPTPTAVAPHRSAA